MVIETVKPQLSKPPAHAEVLLVSMCHLEAIGFFLGLGFGLEVLHALASISVGHRQGCICSKALHKGFVGV